MNKAKMKYRSHLEKASNSARLVKSSVGEKVKKIYFLKPVRSCIFFKTLKMLKYDCTDHVRGLFCQLKAWVLVSFNVVAFVKFGDFSNSW